MTTTPPRAQWILFKMVKSYKCARSTRRWPMTLFFFLMDAACLNASVVWFMTHPEWKRKESHKRRSFMSAVAYDMMKPMIDYRSQSANISHMPTVSRAMLTIGVEPVASTSEQIGSKKRGRCQSYPRFQKQKVEHRCTECQQFACMWQARKETIVYTCVVCPLRLQSDTRDDEWTKTLDRASSFCEECGFFYIIEPLCSGLSTIWKNSLNLFA